MGLTSTYQKPNFTRRRKLIRFKVTPTGNYTTGGDPLDLTAITNPKFEQNPGFRSVPSLDDIYVVRAPAGYGAELVAGTGTTLATALKLKVFTTANTELAAGAYPGALTGDSFLIEADVSTWGN